MRPIPLPRLAFGNRSPRVFSSHEAISSFFSSSGAVVDGIRATNSDFHYKVSQIVLPKLKVFSSASDAFEIDTLASENDTVIDCPLEGSGQIRDGKKNLQWKSPANVIYQAYGGEQNFSFETRRSGLFFMVEADRLNITIETMFNESETDWKNLVPSHPIVAELTVAEQNVRSVLLSTLMLVDLPDNDQDHLIRIGFDDVIHRLLAEMTFLRFRSGSEQAPVSKIKRSTKALDVVCDYITSHTDKVLTSTEMEQMTGMTSRALYGAFIERFNSSPQEWKRNVHLDHARVEMMNPHSLASVKTIARQFGFVSSQSFSKFYQRRFGELPSETLKRG
jgi:AraC-like DNA-binding protein